MQWLLDMLATVFAKQDQPKLKNIAFDNEPAGAAVDVQLHAFQYMLASCEGTAAEDGYRYLFGSNASNDLRFDDFTQHPNIRRTYVDKSGRNVVTTAAGRYQINFPTYQSFGGGAFTPAAQDVMCASIIRSCGAMDDIEAGRLQAAIDRCAARWASLPSSTVAQPHRSFDYCRKVFEAAGGRVSE